MDSIPASSGAPPNPWRRRPGGAPRARARGRTGAGRAAALALIAALACAPGPGLDALARDEPAPWRPDSADVIFASNRGGNSEVYLRAAGSAEWTNLTRHPGADNWPEWSPDGRKIAFQSSRAGKLDIWVMNADGSEQKQLTDHPEPDYLPAWTPDGKRITFTSWRREEQDTTRAPHIYVMDADGSDLRRLVKESLGTSSGAAWSRDGKWIAFSRQHGKNGARVCVARADGSRERIVTDGAAYDGSATFSPDGKRLAFYSDHGGHSSLEVVNVDGSGRRTLLARGKNWYPRWSPDGRWLLYTAPADSTDSKNLDLYAIPVEGGAPVRLLGDKTRESEGRWRPIGK